MNCIVSIQESCKRPKAAARATALQFRPHMASARHQGRQAHLLCNLPSSNMRDHTDSRMAAMCAYCDAATARWGATTPVGLHLCRRKQAHSKI